MFVASYLGPESGQEAWNTLVSRHAADIGMRSQVAIHQAQGGNILLLTWFIPRALGREVSIARSDGALIFSADPIDRRFGCGVDRIGSWDGLLHENTENSIKLGIHPTSSEIRVNVPATTPEQCYYAATKDARVLSTDMRFLVHWAGFELDELSIHSLFQFGVIPPNCSISCSVSRIPAGHNLTWLPEEAEPELRPIYRLTCPESEEEDPEKLVESAIDRLIDKTPKNSVLLFSGGVDSGLLAARCIPLARRDIRLINFAFAADDPQGKYAEQVAHSLGFDCDQVIFDMHDIPKMLERIGRDYSFPFVDSSSLPTNLLVEKTAEIAGEPTVVIEGTGADGEFGFGPSIDGWSRIHRVPTFVRRAIGHSYDKFAFWRNAPTERIEFLVRACRQSVRYSLGADVFCQDGLDGFAYEKRPGHLEAAVFTAISELTAGMSPESALSCTDMIQVCAGRFAAKSFDPLRSRGFMPLYPFMDPSILRLSLALPWSVKCNRGERKALLKKILLKSVPHELVYRRKSGFRAPMPRIIASDVFQDYLRNVALARDNPIVNFLKVENVRKIIDRVNDGHRVAAGVHTFLWCLVFVSSWLSQCGFSGRQRR